MSNRVEARPERRTFRDVAGVDLFFIAVAGVIAVAVVVGIMLQK